MWLYFLKNIYLICLVDQKYILFNIFSKCTKIFIYILFSVNSYVWKFWNNKIQSIKLNDIRVDKTVKIVIKTEKEVVNNTFDTICVIDLFINGHIAFLNFLDMIVIFLAT